MKQVVKKISLVVLAAALMAPASLLAQNADKDKVSKDKKDREQIIITRTGGGDEKIVVEVVGDKVIVNGKEIDKNDKDGDVNVIRTKIKDVWAYGGGNNLAGVQAWNTDEHGDVFSNRIRNVDENRVMLGVTTEKTEKGAEIQDITKESGAEKAGLKKGDIITKIDDTKIEGPDDLSATIKNHKSGDKVSVSYLRDKKEQKVTAELTKWKGVSAYSVTTPGHGFNMNIDGMDFDNLVPRARLRSLTPFNQTWSWSGNGGPKLGLSVQDTEDGKGVNVLEVDEDGNAGKAGIQEEDVITDVDGKAVNSADEIAKIMKESKDKTAVKVKLLRKGKVETVDVKIPRKLKTADL